MVDEPLHTLLESGEAFKRRRLEDECSIERDEAHETAHGQLHRVPGPELDRVVVHPVLLVPETGLRAVALVRHGVRDEDEVLEELGGYSSCIICLQYITSNKVLATHTTKNNVFPAFHDNILRFIHGIG